jgi:hypothetical protein
MASVPQPIRDWLLAHDFVDDGVDLDRVRLRLGGPPTWYLRLVHKRAITLGHQVWFREEQYRADRALIAHELVHVGQYGRRGRIRFIATYIWHLVHARGYSRTLPLEVPAYTRQTQAEQAL